MQYDYVILDVEIGNEIPKGKGWDNKLGQITCLGAIFIRNGAISHITQLFKFRENNHFASEVIELLRSMERLGISMFALNSQFEIDTLEVLTGEKFEVMDLRHNMKGHLSSKESLYNLLLDNNLVPRVSDIYEGNGALCISDYKEYLLEGDFSKVQRILQHNQNCLIKEFLIKNNIDWILKHTKVDSKGWILSYE